MQPLDSGYKSFSEQSKSGKIDIGKTMGIRVVLFDLKIAFVVEQTIQNKRRVTVGTFVRQAKVRRKINGDEALELDGKVIERMAIGLKEHLTRQGKPLSVATGGFPLAPDLGNIQVANGIDHLSERTALIVIMQLPVGNLLEAMVADAVNNLCHRVDTDLTGLSHDGFPLKPGQFLNSKG